MRNRRKTVPLHRFLKYIDGFGTSGCWEWTGGTFKAGYGMFNDGTREGRAGYAHRFSYETYVGPIPLGLCVCHKCDNRRCVNPLHLFLGTHGDNQQDKLDKGRHVSGWAQVRKASLSAVQVAEIRAAYVRGSRENGTVALGKRFGVSQSVIHRIVTRQTYRKSSLEAEKRKKQEAIQ